MSNHIVSMAFFGVALIFLMVRLITGKKRDFILSILMVVLGSGYATFTIAVNPLPFFFVAIVFSFIGDLLMAEWIKITEHRTVDGIMAFGLAHIVYIIAFYQLGYGEFTLLGDWYLILFGLILCLGLYRLVGSSDELHWSIKTSNFIYAILITSLLVLVLSFVFASTTPLLVKLAAGFGVILFVISDSVLAYNEFQSEIPNAKEIIAGTYILAQILLQLTPLLTYVFS